MNRHWNAAMSALVLIRLGQELGTDSPAARALHDLLELLACVPWNFLR
jgi:4-diphosphocytidyl-2C-methyl-D-erythritol kinase